MKGFYFTLALLMALSPLACNKKEAAVQDSAKVEAAAGAQSLLDKAEYTKEGLLKIVADPKAVKAEEYEAILLGIEKCPVKDNLDFDASCPAMQAYKALGNKADYSIEQSIIDSVHAALLKSDRSKVKAIILQDSRDLVKTDPQAKQAILAALKDVDPQVVKSALLGSLYVIEQPEVLDAVLPLAKHENPWVRRQVATSISKATLKDNETVVTTLITLLGDKDQGVRSVTCSSVGEMNDERFVEPMVAILSNADDVASHLLCISGLESMWFDYPMHKNTSEAAYKATTDYLKRTPRTKDVPAHGVLTAFKKKSDNKFADWQTRATYFKAEEFAAVFAEIAADPNAHKFARRNALLDLAFWGTRADLEALDKKLNTESDKDASALKETLQAELGKL